MLSFWIVHSDGYQIKSSQLYFRQRQPIAYIHKHNIHQYFITVWMDYLKRRRFKYLRFSWSCWLYAPHTNVSNVVTLRASEAVVQCIVIGPVCLFVGVWVCVCLWVCYHDNSKLRASILTKLGLQVKVVTNSSWLKFWPSSAPGKGSAAGRNFVLRLTTASAQCLRLLRALFSLLLLL